MARRPIIGVLGGGTTDPETERLARRLGEHIARTKAILLCGGRGGIMEAAARGAKEQDGRTIGILPGRSDRPNAWIDCPIWTGLGDGRNYVNVCASDVLIALPGGPGTLSEIALALKVGRPVVYLAAWRFLQDHGFSAAYVETPAEAVEEACRLMPQLEAGRIEGGLNYPDLPSQHVQKAQFEKCVLADS